MKLPHLFPSCTCLQMVSNTLFTLAFQPFLFFIGIEMLEAIYKPEEELLSEKGWGRRKLLLQKKFASLLHKFALYRGVPCAIRLQGGVVEKTVNLMLPCNSLSGLFVFCLQLQNFLLEKLEYFFCLLSRCTYALTLYPAVSLGPWDVFNGMDWIFNIRELSKVHQGLAGIGSTKIGN